MFDALEFFDAPLSSVVATDEASHHWQTSFDSHERTPCAESDADPLQIAVLDLPRVSVARPEAIIAVLLLLQPPSQVDFTSEMPETKPWQAIAREKNIEPEQLSALLQYYRSQGNVLLNSEQRLCELVPTLLQGDNSELLKYYTSILSYYECSCDELTELITQHASLRIAERCGRTAQPAVTRGFRVDGIDEVIQLHEPSLTSDSLGLKTWGASLLLAQRMHRLPPSSAVLELGAGTGLVGLAYALSHRAHPGRIILTDLAEIVSNLERNVKLNNTPNAQVSVLDWRDPSTFAARYGYKSFDTILVSDPIYSAEHPIWLISTIKALLAPGGNVYIELPIRERYVRERQLFFDRLRADGFKIVLQSQEQGSEDWGQITCMYMEVVHE